MFNKSIFIFGKYDEYSIKARFFPAFICMLPFLIFICFEFKITEDLQKSKYFLIPIYMIIVWFLSYISRDLGKKIENKHVIKNNYFPTTYMLSFKESAFDPYTLKRYHQILNKKIPDLNLPLSLKEEEKDPNSLEKYTSAINWLRNNANGDQAKYPLVYKELIKYGFCRNLLGIKCYSILIYFLVLIREFFTINSFSITQLFKSPWPTYANFILFFISIILILFYNKNNLKSNTLAYGKALIETCEKL